MRVIEVQQVSTPEGEHSSGNVAGGERGVEEHLRVDDGI